ncbi:MAG: hypothetical protein HOO06_05035 [Bdellovibrionaceae bacterium]|jgi:hypothetical protein|nr:hypothetical protein [Pseudobdellovibrionaceae bacterium]
MKIKKAIISLLAILPISSIAFAADYNLNSVDVPVEPEQVEEEFLQRLEDNQLPLKYYRFLKEHKIENSDQLLSDDNLEKKNRLLDEYSKDYVAPLGRVSGTISIM